MIRINNIKIDLDFGDVKKLISQQSGISIKDIQQAELVRKSIDARNKINVFFICSFDLTLKNEEKYLNFANVEKIEHQKPLDVAKKQISSRPIIIGSGPAGMFAGIVLAEAGANPIIIERGSEVSKRKKDVELFWTIGKLNTESNVQFGEGGAGTFSDGKLMSGIKKDIYTTKVLQEFVNAGAPQEILYLAKPHIGTDKLEIVVKNIRNKIISLGGEYHFDTKLEDFIIKDEKLVGVLLKSGSKVIEMATDNVVLAIGHSSRDTFGMIYNRGLNVEQKAFSVGARIEHKQELINKSQYGKCYNHKSLGAAEYKLAVHLPNGRSCYTFCMCPGGEVVAAASENEMLVTNGMSHFSRNKENANSAVLVEVTPKDFKSSHPLAGIDFQRDLERKAFNAGGRNYNAPAQLVGDFLKDKKSNKLGSVVPSYTPNVSLTNLGEVLPKYVVETMQYALGEMDKKIHGFASFDAVLTGVETRSSSPVRIKRDETMQSNIKGIYPCGEGAGYAGGIMSAAVDGIKVALKIVG